MTQLNSRAACQPHTQLLRLDATQAAPPSGIKSGTTLHSNAVKEKQFRRLCSQVSVASPCLCSYQARGGCGGYTPQTSASARVRSRVWACFRGNDEKLLRWNQPDLYYSLPEIYVASSAEAQQGLIAEAGNLRRGFSGGAEGSTTTSYGQNSLATGRPSHRVCQS